MYLFFNFIFQYFSIFFFKIIYLFSKFILLSNFFSIIYLFYLFISISAMIPFYYIIFNISIFSHIKNHSSVIFVVNPLAERIISTLTERSSMKIKTKRKVIVNLEFDKVKDMQDHTATPQKEEKKEISDAVNIEGALNNALKLVTFEVEGIQRVDVLQPFSDRREDIVTYVMEEAQQKKGTKWHMSCRIKFVRYDKEGNEIDIVGFF